MASGKDQCWLVPLLFVICINDLDDNVVYIVSKLENVCKIDGIVDSEGGHLKIATGSG